MKIDITPDDGKCLRVNVDVKGKPAVLIIKPDGKATGAKPGTRIAALEALLTGAGAVGAAMEEKRQRDIKAKAKAGR